MKVAVLFSGGKDSVFAAFACQSAGWEVELLTIVPAEYSTMFHHPNVKWCKAQAKEMGMKITVVEADGTKEKEEGEKGELAAMKSALLKMKVDGVAAGAIESEYQKERVDRIAHELGIRSFAPIWRTGETLLSEQTRYFESYVVAVAAEGLDKGMLTRKFDGQFVKYLKSLKPAVSPHLEGGEGETFVANAPFFRRALKVKKWNVSFDGSSGAAEIASLA
ncbi:MAG: diphthine--ammonia ligase [Candidatus Micrarchaeota archaeon]|nr:diphthine--ammonia ligase [Candidatus Micrarchaeota archaeon]